MRIVTNPGSNFTRAEAESLDVALAPQRIVVDGVEHDTRDGIPLADVDRFVKTARAFPHTVGSSAAELAALFNKVGRDDPEIVTVMTSRKLIQSYGSAVTAARTLASHPAGKRLEIAVVDTTVTDVGAGLVTLLATRAREAGLSFAVTVSMLERVAPRIGAAMSPATLDNLVRGGKASWLLAKVAGALDRGPLLGFVDGELAKVGTVRTTERVAAVVDHVAKKVGRGRVWVGIAHGGAPAEAAELLALARSRLDVAYALVRPIHASIYLYGGPGCLILSAVPVDDLSFDPGAPPFG